MIPVVLSGPRALGWSLQIPLGSSKAQVRWASVGERKVKKHRLDRVPGGQGLV